MSSCAWAHQCKLTSSQESKFKTTLVKDRSISCMRCITLSRGILFAFSCWKQPQRQNHSPIPCQSTSGTLPFWSLTEAGPPATSSTGAARRRLRRTSVIFGPWRRRTRDRGAFLGGAARLLLSCHPTRAHQGPPGAPVRADPAGQPLISAFSSPYRQSAQHTSAPGWNRDCVKPKTPIISGS